jgi:hypothetical protein
MARFIAPFMHEPEMHGAAIMLSVTSEDPGGGADAGNSPKESTMFKDTRSLLLVLILLGGVFTLSIPGALADNAPANNAIHLSENKLIFQGLINKPRYAHSGSSAS